MDIDAGADRNANVPEGGRWGREGDTGPDRFSSQVGNITKLGLISWYCLIIRRLRS